MIIQNPNLRTLMKVEILKAMDLIVRSMNNEEGMDLWLMEGVADTQGYTEYQILEELFEYTDEEFDDVCGTFYEVIRHYGKDGWYVG